MEVQKTHDVFVSYKHRRDSAQAKKLVKALKRRGLRVWFDIDQLALKEEGRIDKAELVSTLTSAVRASRVSVIFAAAMEAVALLPGMTREEALATGDCMIDEGTGTLIAWNWQKLEIDASEEFVEVHLDSCALRTGTMSPQSYSSKDQVLREAETMVMQYLAREG